MEDNIFCYWSASDGLLSIFIMTAEERFIETLYDLLIGAGKSKIDKVMLQFKEVNKELIEENEKLILGSITGICDIHKPKILPYVQRFEWAEDQAKKGLKQIQCKRCKRWFFPSEF